jgi:transposase
MKLKYTISDLRKNYSTDDVCLEAIFANRFPNRIGYHRVHGRKCWSHQSTGHQIFPLAGTIFEKSSTPLTVWFEAIFLFSISKNGISAKEMQRHFGVTYKCAYRIGQQIRKLMEQDEAPLTGIVEADETYMPNGKTARPVIAAVSRSGGTKARVMDNRRIESVHPFIEQSVQKGSYLMTDEANVYKGLTDYKHRPVNHGRGFVKGMAHTNNVEAFWNQVKRSINGTYHWVSPEHLQQYVDEFSFRHSLRASSVPIFEVMMARILRGGEGGKNYLYL